MGLHLPSEGRWAVNYPHLHRKKGVGKEKATNWWFRRTIRMFKNARAQLVDEGRLGPDMARSYHIECLLYNVPNRLLTGPYQSAYSSALYWLRDNDLTRFASQDKQVLVFDRGPDSWNEEDARNLINALVRQHDDW